jgi:phage/plasmid-like protein (TIGR03299 family)
MAHDLSLRSDGSAEMFSGSNEVPWHRLGTVVEGRLTAKEAIQAAHLNWDVEKQDLQLVTGEKVPHFFATVRKDNKKVLGVVKGNYHVVQNDEAFEFFDKVVGEKLACYETAGALSEGRRVWIMAKIPGSMFIDTVEGKDEIERNLLLYTTHDGSSAVSMMQVSTRVVCANTLSVALSGAKNVIKIRHTANYEQKFEEAQKALKIAEAYFNDLNWQLNQLAKEKFNKHQMQEMAYKLVPDTGIQRNTRSIAARSKLVELFEFGKGNHGRTAFDALNAVTEFNDHTRTIRLTGGRSNADARFDSALFGTGAAMKAQAFGLLTA